MTKVSLLFENLSKIYLNSVCTKVHFTYRYDYFVDVSLPSDNL